MTKEYDKLGEKLSELLLQRDNVTATLNDAYDKQGTEIKKLKNMEVLLLIGDVKEKEVQAQRDLMDEINDTIHKCQRELTVLHEAIKELKTRRNGMERQARNARKEALSNNLDTYATLAEELKHVVSRIMIHQHILRDYPIASINVGKLVEKICFSEISSMGNTLAGQNRQKFIGEVISRYDEMVEEITGEVAA